MELADSDERGTQIPFQSASRLPRAPSAVLPASRGCRLAVSSRSRCETCPIKWPSAPAVIASWGCCCGKRGESGWHSAGIHTYCVLVLHLYFHVYSLWAHTEVECPDLPLTDDDTKFRESQLLTNLNSNHGKHVRRESKLKNH